MAASTPTEQARRSRLARFFMSSISIGILTTSLYAVVMLFKISKIIYQLCACHAPITVVIAYLAVVIVVYALVTFLLSFLWNTRNTAIKRLLMEWIKKA